MTWSSFANFLVYYVFLVLSAAVHESAHAWTAYHFGDPTAKMQGRISLNPARHIDIIGTVIVPFMFFLSAGLIFGWAKPTPVNPSYFKNPKRDGMFVSGAGPVSNFLSVLVLAGFWHLARILGSNPLLMYVLTMGVIVNLMLAIFNLLPIPPLDGSGVLEGLLPESLSAAYAKMRPYGFLILLGLFYVTGFGRYISRAIGYIAALLGISLSF